MSNEDSGNITVIDTASDRVIATIPIGKRPRGMKLSPDGARLYVALSGSPKAGPGKDDDNRGSGDRSADGIGVVDTQTNELVRVLPSGQDPECFDVSPDGRTLYVSNEETAETSVVDVDTGRVVTRVAVGEEPEGVTLSPDGRFVYVTSEGAGEVHVIRTGTHEVVAKVPAGPRPRAVAFTPDGRHAFVTAENDHALKRFDAQRHTPDRSIDLGPGARPMGVRISADGATAWVSTGRGGSVVAIDTERGEVTKTIARVGARPWGLDLTHDGKKLYVANGPSNDVAVIDTERGEVVGHVRAGSSPWGVVASRGER